MTTKILLFIIFFNFSSNTVVNMNDLIRFDRNIDNVTISKLLSNNLYSFDMLRVLDVATVSETDKKFLETLEQKKYQKANENKVLEFNRIYNHIQYPNFNSLNEQFQVNRVHKDNIIQGVDFINERKLKDALVKIFNFLFNFIPTQSLMNMFLGIYINSSKNILPLDQNDFSQIRATFVPSKSLDYPFSCIFINSDIYDTSAKEDYLTGFSAVNNDEYGSIVHEWGHALAHFLYIINDRILQANFNRAINISSCDEARNTLISDISPKIYQKQRIWEYNFAEILYNKIIPSNGIITSITALQRKLALFTTALPSQYGWGFGKTANSSPYFFENEYFAEAFTYWFLTPDIQKNYYWELINDTFMEILADIRVYEV